MPIICIYPNIDFIKAFQTSLIKMILLFSCICISACMLGYDGINCTNSCPYPAYGEGCQGICYCEKDMCDVSTGCEPNTTGTCMNLVCLVC